MLAAALGIVATGGLAGLTLRPLANALGVSVTVLSNRYGGRTDIMAAICGAACVRDEALSDGWRATLAALGALPPATAAGLAEAILEEQSSSGRALSALYLEFLQACTWDATLRPAFAGWAARRRAFWDEFAGRAGLAAPLAACGWWNGYVIAELAYGMALDGDASYRLLRRLGLQRLFAGALAAPGAVDGILFGLLRGRMQCGGGGGGECSAVPVTGPGASGGPAWSAQAARACGRRLAARGIDGLTHRAIAAEIGIAHTTLSYRFPTQRDLVIAGLEWIAGHIRSAVEADSLAELQRLRGEEEGLDPARASFAVALAAARLPELARQAAYMRAWRGSNLAMVFARYLQQARGIDPLCAQLVSMGLTGLTNTMPPGAHAEEAVATAFAAAGDWLRGER